MRASRTACWCVERPAVLNEALIVLVVPSLFAKVSKLVLPLKSRDIAVLVTGDAHRALLIGSESASVTPLSRKVVVVWPSV